MVLSPVVRATRLAMVASLLLLAGAPLGCGGGASPESNAVTGADTAAVESSAEWREGSTRSGVFTVAWRPVGGPIPFNEPFELDIRVERSADGTPVEGAEVRVAANMPEHGHGMMREPGWEEREDGNYRITGMLMHMTGHWVLSIDVVVGSKFETAEFPIEMQ